MLVAREPGQWILEAPMFPVVSFDIPAETHAVHEQLLEDFALAPRCTSTAFRRNEQAVDAIFAVQHIYGSEADGHTRSWDGHRYPDNNAEQALPLLRNA
jgi:hypothetical protein